MGNFAENLNLGNRFRPPPPWTRVYDPNFQKRSISGEAKSQQAGTRSSGDKWDFTQKGEGDLPVTNFKKKKKKYFVTNLDGNCGNFRIF